MNERNLYHRLNSFSYTELKTFTLGCIDRLEKIEDKSWQEKDELTEILKICECFFKNKFGKNLPEIISYYQKKAKKKAEIQALEVKAFEKKIYRFIIASVILTVFFTVAQNFEPLLNLVYTVDQFFELLFHLPSYIFLIVLLIILIVLRKKN